MCSNGNEAAAAGAAVSTDCHYETLEEDMDAPLLKTRDCKRTNFTAPAYPPTTNKRHVTLNIRKSFSSDCLSVYNVR